MLKRAITAVSTTSVLIIFLASGGYEYIYGLLMAPQPQFEISANPESLILGRYKESVNSTMIILKSIRGFDGNVSLQVTKSFGIIGDIIFEITFPTVYVPSNGEIVVQLILRVRSYVTPGNYYIDLVGTSGTLSQSVRIPINIPNE